MAPVLLLEQLALFLEALALGFAIGLGYDFYRAFCFYRGRPPAAALFLGDCLFWLLATGASLIYLLLYRGGQLYFYSYAGLALGALIYFSLLSGFLRRWWSKLLRVLFPFGGRLKAAGLRLAGLLLPPLAWPGKLAVRGGALLGQAFYRGWGRIFSGWRRN